MTTPPKRADPFDIGGPGDFSDFAPTPASKPKPKTDAALIRQVSEAANFPSRAPAATPAPVKAPAAAARTMRRHRTGRNVQLNLKATPETIERFTRICDARGWVYGETLARALDALEDTFKSSDASR